MYDDNLNKQKKTMRLDFSTRKKVYSQHTGCIIFFMFRSNIYNNDVWQQQGFRSNIYNSVYDDKNK